MARKIKTYPQYNSEAYNYTVNFNRAVTKASSNVSSVVWSTDEGQIIAISGEFVTNNTATALLTADGNNTGIARISVLATLANGEKIRIYFDVNVAEER